MEFELKDVIYIVGIVTSVLISHFTTRHGLKEYTRDKYDELKDHLSDLKLELSKQKAKDDLQQQVIDQIGQQTKDLIPKLLEILKHKKQENE